MLENPDLGWLGIYGTFYGFPAGPVHEDMMTEPIDCDVLEGEDDVDYGYSEGYGGEEMEGVEGWGGDGGDATYSDSEDEVDDEGDRYVEYREPVDWFSAGYFERKDWGFCDKNGLDMMGFMTEKAVLGEGGGWVGDALGWEVEMRMRSWWQTET